MKHFYQEVDKRSRKKMIGFLQGHFRYSLGNRWNDSTYACNLKIHTLHLEPETQDALYELIQCDEFYDEIDFLTADFGEQHNWLWQAGFRGRSGGYLVLIQGERKPSGYKSFCTSCGQRNYTSVKETGSVCGVCRKATRVDYSKKHMSVNQFPCRGTDTDEDFLDFDMYELRERVDVVQEFDRLADKIVEFSIELAQNASVAEETYFVENTRKVMVLP